MQTVGQLKGPSEVGKRSWRATRDRLGGLLTTRYGMQHKTVPEKPCTFTYAYKAWMSLLIDRPVADDDVFRQRRQSEDIRVVNDVQPQFGARPRASSLYSGTRPKVGLREQHGDFKVYEIVHWSGLHPELGLIKHLTASKVVFHPHTFETLFVRLSLGRTKRHSQSRQ